MSRGKNIPALFTSISYTLDPSAEKQSPPKLTHWIRRRGEGESKWHRGIRVGRGGLLKMTQGGLEGEINKNGTGGSEGGITILVPSSDPPVPL